MKRIFVMNTKGGSGKTTLANELAYSLDRTNTPYSFFNLDPQGGSPHKESLSDDAIIQIADTPGHGNAADVSKWARAADIVVIPVRSSALDAHAFAATLRAVRENNPSAKILVVQNGWNRWSAAREFETFLRGQIGEDVPLYPLSQSEMIVQATARKKSVIDRAPRSRVAAQTLDIVNATRKAAGLDPEQSKTKNRK